MSILTAAGWHSRAICYEDLSRDTAQSRTCRLNYYTPVNFFFVKTKEKKSEKKTARRGYSFHIFNIVQDGISKHR